MRPATMCTRRWTGCWTARTPIEAGLAGRHLREGGIAMFDLSSSWVEGSHCELAARGYSRDGKKGREQIEYGLLTDPEGRPVAIRVFAGNTADPAAFIQAADVIRGKFGLPRAGHGRRPRDDHLRPDPGAERRWAGCRGSPACAPRRSASSPPTAARCS